MSEGFKAITTQEEFDAAVKIRLLREQETLAKKYADYETIKTRNTELEAEVGQLKTTVNETGEAAKTYDQTVSELNAKIAGYETASMRTKIALQNGLPIDLADRLVGDDEASIKADAERLAGFVSKQRTIAPLRNTEPQIQEDEDKDLREMLQKLNERGE